MTSKPTVKRGPASRYAGPGETILEISSEAGGGLLSLRVLDDGDGHRHLRIEVYGADEGVTVTAGTHIEIDASVTR